MYSVVLLAGMAAGSDNTPAPVAVAAAPVSGCMGCTGCTGYVAGCTGCTGSCHGSCHGGGLFSRMCGHKTSCHGCYGSCYGSCFGSVGMPPYGSCFSNGYTYGGYGAVYSYPAYSTYSQPPVVVVPVENKFIPPANKTGSDSKVDVPKPMDPVKPNVVDPLKLPEAPKPNLVDPLKPKDPLKPNNNGAANLKFQLPADAKLYVDGRLTSGSGSERTFFTPTLERGQKFYYEVKAELMVNGEMVTEEKRVIVEAGASLVETFPKLTAAIEKASTIAGK